MSVFCSLCREAGSPFQTRSGIRLCINSEWFVLLKVLVPIMLPRHLNPGCVPGPAYVSLESAELWTRRIETIFGCQKATCKHHRIMNRRRVRIRGGSSTRINIEPSITCAVNGTALECPTRRIFFYAIRLQHRQRHIRRGGSGKTRRHTWNMRTVHVSYSG